MKELEKVVSSEEDRCWCVYIHTNVHNGKKYIGITSNTPENRWGVNGSKYLCKRKDGRYYHDVMAKALNKYPDWNNDWIHEIVFSDISHNEAVEKEIELIALYKTNCSKYKNPPYGYNLTDGGEGTIGYEYSEETRQKMSESAKARCTDEWRERISIINTGKNVSEDFRQKRRDYMSIPIVQIDTDFSFVAEYDSAKQAGTILGIDDSSIRKSCKDHHKTAGGFFWVTKEDWENLKILDFKKSNLAGVEIVQLKLDGAFVQIYQSAAEASRKTGIPKYSILKCCNNKQQQAGGYIWVKKENYNSDYKIPKIKPIKIPVIQLDINQKFIARYDSAKKAGETLNIDPSWITKCCKHRKRCKTAGGFVWMYEEEYEQLNGINGGNKENE